MPKLMICVCQPVEEYELGNDDEAECADREPALCPCSDGHAAPDPECGQCGGSGDAPWHGVPRPEGPQGGALGDTRDEPLLIEFQLSNCAYCQFAEEAQVGTGRPCCTFAGRLVHEAGRCVTRREA